MEQDPPAADDPTAHLRAARELQGHLAWLDSFTPLALGVLSVASGIYTYLGVSGLLEENGALSFFAAVAYSVAVSVGIFVFWSYMLRLVPAMTTMGDRIAMGIAGLIGAVAICAMSAWLNAAALAGSAAVEQHLALTIQSYQAALERSHANALAAQGLAQDVGRARANFASLAEQEQAGALSGVGGQGAVFALLTQKVGELGQLEAQIAAQAEPIAEAFEQGQPILNRMRELVAAPGPVEDRSVAFSEQSVRLAAVIVTLRQLSIAPQVLRAAQDLRASVVLPDLDGRTAATREAQSSTLDAVLRALDTRADALAEAAAAVIALPAPAETTYAPISTADAVIRYAGDFVPAWAGALAIDLLPGVLVIILAITQGALRSAQAELRPEHSLTIAEVQAAMAALRRIDAAPSPPPSRPKVLPTAAE